MYWGSTAKANAEQVEKSVFETSKSIVETLDAQIKRIDERNAALAYKPDLKENASTEAIGALQQKINQLQSLKTNSDQEETVRLVEINKLLAARGQIEQRVAEFSQKSEEERSRRAKAAAGVAAQEILQKQSGVPKSYLTDLKTLKDAWDTGAMSQEVYVKAVSQLANETYKASTAGKEAAKGASAEAKANKAGARAGAAVDRDSMAEQIAAYKNTDKAILDSRQDFYTAMGYAAQMGEKTSLEAITQGLDQEFEVWMQRSALINAELELLKKKKNSQKEQEDARGRLAALERDYEQAQLKGAGEVAVILRQQSVAFVEAEASAKSYLDTLNLQYSRELAGVGQGTKTRDRASAVAQITDRYDQQAQQVESDQRRGAFKDNPQQYQRELERIKRYQREALSSYNAYYDAMQAKQGSWELGAREGIANYFEQSQTVFQQTEALVGNAFKGMEDGLMQFVTTGKGGFKALADSLIADMIRIALKQAVLGPLMNAVGSFLPGMGSAAAASSAGTSSSIATMIATPTFAAKGHAFDAGGLVPFARGGVFNSPTAFGFGGGKLGVLGEAGPEAIMPLTRGPDGKLGLAGGGGGGGSSTVSVVINNNSAEKATASETVDSRGGRRIEVTIGELVAAELRRPGSASNNAMRSAFGSAPALVGR
jgi:lambda family phage tail tape measure protein